MSASESAPLVSVVILNWNRYEDTLLCLKHVRELTYANIEIVVVDNGSVDGSKQKLKDEPGIIYVDNPTNRGFTGGHIDGLAKCSGEFILLLNNDALISPDYIDKALAHFSNQAVAVVGGRAYMWDENNPVFDTSNAYFGYQDINPTTGEGFFVRSDSGYAQEVNNVSGSAVVVRRSVVDQVGYLYEPFFAYFEETDLFARMKRAGYKVVYDPALHIWHKGGVSSNSYFQFYQLFKNRFIFAMRNFQSDHLVRFLYIYTRIGLSSIVRQGENNEQQVMRKAYAKAFIRAWLSFPKQLFGRLQLERSLGKSHYNDQLEQEQRGISFVIDMDTTSEFSGTISATHWLSAIEKNPRHEVVFVTKDEALYSKIKNIVKATSLAKVVLDRRQFNTHAANIGWLSSQYSWIYLSDSPMVPYIPELETQLSVAARNHASLLQVMQDGKPTQTALFSRNFLIRTGGLPIKESVATSKAFLYSYALVAKTLNRGMQAAALGIKSRALTIPNDEAFKINLHQAREVDTFTLSNPGALERFLAKHRHIRQVFDTAHWLVSLRISPRLKFARLRNLAVAIVTLHRNKFAVELKHIRNEVRKAHKLDHTQKFILNKTKEQIRHYLESPQSVPVFIICRDRISTLSLLLERLEFFGLTNISFIDNDSAFPPLLEYYANTPYQVFRTGQNVGHKSPWESGFIKTLAPNAFYIVTDPDVIPVEDCPAAAISYLLQLHKKHIEHQKVGFGLKIDDLPDHYIHKQAVITWESQFWLQPLEPGVFEVPLDTTFALYKPFNYRYFLHPSIRTGEPYVARHLPWYVDNTKVDPEEQYYRSRASGEVTSWTVETLGDTFQKELAKQPTSST
jgi:GT2 family glycosyltransferase